ncbi:hypothetical protein [Cribrihabitans neustonicus]|uniref:hypothetical protein n=1 Tax=Cribrihabitans neustonicus TaxID=1429085 RepID=UPI003B5C0C4B
MNRAELDRLDLDRALLSAHADHDLAALVRLYTVAGDRAEAAGDINAACFYLTHAFVFALEAGAPEAGALNARLAEHGRAHRLAL